MKMFLKIFIGFFVLIGLGVASIFYFTSDMVSSTDEFFAMVGANEVDSAYQGLSSAFKAETTLEQLNAFLSASGLSKFKEASWNSRSIKNGLGTLEGSVTTTDGATIPLEIQLVKEDGSWKIQHLSRKAAGVSTEKGSATESKTEAAPVASKTVPSNDELVSMVRATMREFGKSIDGKSMESFHGYISNLWRSQYTVEKLEESYGKLYKMGAKWSSLENMSPVFEAEPVIDERGVLIVKGHYPTNPDTLTFAQKYIKEGLDWKLFGLHVNLRSTKKSK